MKAEVMSSSRFQQLKKTIKHSSIQLNANLWLNMIMLYKNFTLFSKKQKKNNPPFVNVPFFLLKPAFLVQDSWFRWKKRTHPCRWFPSSWEHLIAEACPILSHTMRQWRNKHGSHPEGSWAFFGWQIIRQLQLFMQQGRNHKQHCLSGLRCRSITPPFKLPFSCPSVSTFSLCKTNCSSPLAEKAWSELHSFKSNGLGYSPILIC